MLTTLRGSLKPHIAKATAFGTWWTVYNLDNWIAEERMASPIKVAYGTTPHSIVALFRLKSLRTLRQVTARWPTDGGWCDGRASVPVAWHAFLPIQQASKNVTRIYIPKCLNLPVSFRVGSTPAPTGVWRLPGTAIVIEYHFE